MCCSRHYWVGFDKECCQSIMVVSFVRWVQVASFVAGGALILGDWGYAGFKGSGSEVGCRGYFVTRGKNIGNDR